MTKRLLVKKHGKIIPRLTREISVGDIITVGNDPSAVIELDEEGILPEQFVIINESGQPLLLCRTDGVLVNDRFLRQGALHELRHEDKILVGNYSLQYEAEGSFIRAETDGDEISPTAITEDLWKDAAIVPPGIQPPAGAAAEEEEEEEEEEAGNDDVHKTIPVNREQTLTDILESLRAEEKYYFQIEKVTGENRRVYVEHENMRLGWSSAGECVIGAADAVETPKARVRKDWTGVILYPCDGQPVWLNNETLNEPRRLKNDDRILLSGLAATGEPERSTLIRFHEPTALLVLDSILPKELPPPVSLETAQGGGRKAQKSAAATTGGNLAAVSAANEETVVLQANLPPPRPKPAARVFGYFTWAEIAVMIIGTLVTAAVIFLVLELSY
ncbi:MAG: FHA domain-containing protein [Acidobacteriota bacterium]|nr:FHA domain-containing protein [Acidobacteriota bacterium]